MTQSVTPVLLLTGYLGSGKTTLLNRILQNKQGIKFAVIVNDIGEVNIDANLIAKGGIVGEGDDSLVPLQNGCICCTLKMDLVQQLSDIVSEQRFDYIVIEASGICEPAPIAQTISVYPQMYPNLATKGIARLDSVVTVVDALRLRDEFSEGHDLYKKDMKEDDLASLVIQQIEFCNTILLNKSSEVSAEELGRIKAIIREIQPKAEIITCDYCDVDLDKLVNSNSFDFEQVATSAKWIAAVEGDEEEKEEHEHHHHHAHDHEEEENDEHEHHHHDHDHCHCHHHHGLENEEEGEALEYGISTFVYKRREPFDMTEFDQLVARLWPSSVIRCKGLCYFATEPDMCYVFEQAGKQVSLSQAGQWYATMPADELEQFKQQNPAAFKDWDDKYGDRMQKLVFIGQHMDREAIETLLDACIKK
jgi:G3E family GTPase|uniref:CobW family GTP-binding protein n=1 Tax=Alloprevotella sp. TaxID=1872471 RepID=UPI003FD7240B